MFVRYFSSLGVAVALVSLEVGRCSAALLTTSGRLCIADGDTNPFPGVSGEEQTL